MALDETVGDSVDTTLPNKIEQMQMWYDRINEIFATEAEKRQGLFGHKITSTDLIHERQQVLKWLRKNKQTIK
ncbi:MAG: hypothetical protein FGM16_06760 [Flavobacterium sp.]|nr:hypothetical protein [Flavobacterium sp.]